MSNWQAAEEGDLQDEFDQLELDSAPVEKDSILFVVNCSAEMFLPNGQLSSVLGGEEASSSESANISAFQAALKCVSSVMKSKIISSENDKIGLLCYGTEKSKNPAGFTNIYLLQDLEVPDAPSILEIEKYIDNPAAFGSRVGSTEKEFPFGNVFWSAANIFSQKHLAGTTKRIFLFTCEDSPNSQNEALQRAAITRGKDLSELGITLDLFPLPRPTTLSNFKVHSFYSSILPDLLSTSEEFSNNYKFEELLAQVRRRQVRKRALARTQLSLGANMNLSVKLFSLFMETKKGQYVWINERSGQVMQPKTEWKCKETGRTLQPEEFKFSFDYGGEQIVFSREELKRIYKFDDELGLKILGFKPRSVLKPSHNVTHSNFIYPDENVVGSVTVFSSLLKNCLEMNKLIVCRWTARRGSPPRLVALLPQGEQIDEIGTQIKAPGFNMIILPFSDDIRHLKFDSEVSEQAIATHDQIDKAKNLISKLTIPGNYDPNSFDNPVLQRHYANLQALALDQEVIEGLEDCTVPNYERIHSRAGDLINEFKDSIGGIQEASVSSGKRKAAPKEASESFDPLTAISAVKTDPDALAKFTVADLKAYLESVGIKAKRLKAEIIEQIIQ